MDTVRSFVSEISALESANSLDGVLESHVRRLGFDYFSYATIGVSNPKSLHSPFAFLSCNYPAAWVERYLARSYVLKDPVLSMARLHRRPFTWGGELGGWDLTGEQKRILDEGAEFGLGHGLTIPIHGPGKEAGLFTLAAKGSVKALIDAVRDNGNLLHLIGIHTHAFVVERIIEREASKEEASLQLTPREKEVLLWTARGKTSWETAKLIQRSQATVNYHLQNATRKLNAANKCEAAAKAAAAGMFNI